MLPVQGTYEHSSTWDSQLEVPSQLNTEQVLSLQTKPKVSLFLPNTRDQKISSRRARFT